MEAVNAARTPKFAPLRPDLGDTGAFSAVDADTGTLPAAAADFADTANLPAAADFDALASAASSPGLSAPVGGDDGPAYSLGSLRVPTFGTEVSQAAQHDVIVPPPASLGEENRLPIFESVESDWFRRSRHGSDDAATGETEAASAPAGGDWDSPADAGWEAAEMAHAPVTGGTTGAGLPKRVPQANLVPGGVGGSSSTSPAPARSAAQTRERLANFQRGIREGRAAAQDNEASGGEDGDTALYDVLCAA